MPPPPPVLALAARIAAAARHRRGTAALEFGLIAPVLFMLVFGSVKFGIAIENYQVLTSAAQQGAQTLAMARGTSTPFTATVAAIDSAATTLARQQITMSLLVNGTACTSDSQCPVSTPGQIASVQLSYPCDLNVMGISFGGSVCKLSTQGAAVLQ